MSTLPLRPLLLSLATLLLGGCVGPVLWQPEHCQSGETAVAVAGEDRTVPARGRVELDGSASHAGIPDPLFRWELVVAPTGSNAKVESADSAVASFVPDVAGHYTLRLVLDDGCDTGAVEDRVTLEAVELPPVATASAPPSRVTVGDTVVLAGSGEDGNGDALTFTWTLTSKPSGSAAVLSNATQATATLVPDVEGEYRATFKVDDGRQATAPVEVRVTAQRPVQPVPFRIADAEYSRGLDRVVAVSPAPDPALHVFAPLDGTDVSVALPAAPLVVSVSPDGRTAAVGHDGSVSHVDLVGARVLATWTVGVPAQDVVLGDAGIAYVFPGTSGSNILTLNLSTGATTRSSVTAASGTRAVLAPGRAIYGATPSSVERYAPDSRGTLQRSWTWSYTLSQYDPCGNLWAAEDGSHVFTGCGGVFRTGATQTEDLRYVGSLQAMSRVQHLAHSAAAGQLAVLAASSNWVYRYAAAPTLTQQPGLDLPERLEGGVVLPTRGRFVFYDSTGSHLFVFVGPYSTTNDDGTVGLVVY